MTREWRLLVEGPGDGTWNMAVDRAIQLLRDSGDAPPTLRLYRWQDPTLSLGRFQKVDSALLGRCAELGVDIVRRPTGGRGVLHDDEVTYSVVASVEDGVPRGTSPSYHHLCAGIVETYRRLGVDASLTARDRGERHSSACYLHATEADVSAGLAKLSGSAQVWHGGTCLQHGSFTRSRDVEREASIFELGPDEARALEATTATLEGLTDTLPSEDEIVRAATMGFAAALDVELTSGGLTSEELEAAEGVAREFAVKAP
jgi:lipoate-protein ligase A